MAQATNGGQGQQRPMGSKPENMSLRVGHLITLAAFLIPAILLGLIGLGIGNMNTAIGFATVWVGFLFAASIVFQRKRTFLVVERFGLLWDIKYAGLRIVIPFVDNVVLRGDFLQKEAKLFMGGAPGERIEIDFIGGSAPIDASAWYQIANPDDVDAGRWEETVDEQVLRYVYRVRENERSSRVAAIFQDAFRPLLERKPIEEAQSQMRNLADEATETARDALAEMGVYPFPKKGIVIRDMDIPQDIIELRKQVLRGEMDAKEAVNRAAVYWQPVAKMKEGLAAAGITDVTDEQLFNIFLQQKGLDTLQKTDSNLTFVSPDIGAVLTAITGGLKPTSTGGSK